MFFPYCQKPSFTPYRTTDVLYTYSHFHHKYVQPGLVSEAWGLNAQYCGAKSGVLFIQCCKMEKIHGEEQNLLGRNAAQSGSSPTFRRNCLQLQGRLLLVGFLHGLLFNPEVDCCIFLRNVSELQLHYTELHPKIPIFSRQFFLHPASCLANSSTQKMNA
jgi:hypothetical protein